MSAATVATAPTAPSKFDAAILEWITSAKTISAFDKIDVLSACADGMAMKDNIYYGDANNAAATTTPSRHAATRRAATPADTKREAFAALKAEIEGRISTCEKEGQEEYEREQRGAATSDVSAAKATLSDGDDDEGGEIVSAETEATETTAPVATAPEGEEAEPVVETTEETNNNAEGVVAAPSDVEGEAHNATVGSSSGVPAAEEEEAAVPQEEDVPEPAADQTNDEEATAEEEVTPSGEPAPATEEAAENETEAAPKESEEEVTNNATVGSSGVPATADEEKEEAADLPETTQNVEVDAETTEAPSTDATAEEPVSALAEEY